MARMRKQLEQLPPSHIHRKNTAITYLGQMGRNHISSYSEIECRLPVHRSSARASEIRDLEQKESTGISICLSCDSTANGCRSATQSSLVWTETVAPLNTTHAPALEKGKDEQTVHCHGDMSLVVCHRICAGKFCRATLSRGEMATISQSTSKRRGSVHQSSWWRVERR